MKLSLVTGTRNRLESFKRMLDSIVTHTTVPWELIVSDASDVSVIDSVEIPQKVTVISERPPLGHVKGYNVAFRKAQGEWIIWLNDDAEVCPNYDVEAIRFMEAHPQIGLGALHYCEPENDLPFHVNSAYGCLYSNFGIFKRTLGARIGFFDEDLQFYGADNAFAISILMKGFGIMDIPNARIIHHAVKDSIRQENQQYKLSDNRTLTRKYMPNRAQWLATYHKHAGIPEPEAWPHGVRPRRVVVHR